MTGLSTRNIQAIIPVDVHHVLREYAYKRNVTLKYVVANVLKDFVAKVASIEPAPQSHEVKGVKS
jgi:hypothetical protein